MRAPAESGAADVAPPPPHRGLRLRVEPFVFLLYALLSLGIFSNLWFTSTPMLPGGPGDPELATWFLTWPPQALLHHHNPLFSSYMFYPHGLSLMWNVSAVVPALLLFPITATLGPETAFNVMVTLAQPISAFCAFVALRRYVKHDVAAVLGGLLYGFNPYMMAHSGGHVFIMLLFFPPLVLLLLDEMLVRRRRSPYFLGACLGLLTAVQLLTSEEVIMTTLIITVPVLLALVLTHLREVRAALPYLARGVAATLVIFSVLSAYPLYFQFHGPGRLPAAVHPPGIYVADLVANVIPGVFQHFSPQASIDVITGAKGNFVENSGYIGIPLVLLACFATVALWRRTAVRLAMFAVLVTVVLSLGPTLEVAGHDTGVWMPWAALQKLPLLDNVLPARLMTMSYLALAVIVAVLVDAAISSRGVPMRATTAVLVVLSGIALYPIVPFPANPVPIPSFFTSGDVERIPDGSVVLIAPYSHLPDGMTALVWQAAAKMRFRIPEGYGYYPTPGGGLAVLPESNPIGDTLIAYEDGKPVDLNADLRSRMIDELRSLSVHTLIAGPGAGEAQSVDLFRELTGQQPEQVGGVNVWWDVSTVSSLSMRTENAASGVSSAARLRPDSI